MTYRETKKILAESLWMEIEQAVLHSPGVRRSYKKLRAFDPDGDLAKYNLSLDIKKLGSSIKHDEEKKKSLELEHPRNIF